MMLLLSLSLFILGLCIGSFLSVVIMRSVQGRDWQGGRSSCDSCGYQLSWYDNIPLVSYIVLRGSCRKCGASISPLHPFIELLMGLLFVWWYWFGFAFFQLVQQPLAVLQPLFWLMIGIIFIVIIFSDLWYFIIPDWTVGALLVLVVMYRFLLLYMGVLQAQDFWYGVFVATCFTLFFYSLWWITKGRGFGFGDVKLIFPLSLIADWQEAIVAVFLAFIGGSVVGIALLLWGKFSRKQPLPFGPFLIAATVVSLLWGRSIFEWYSAFLLH